MSTANGVLPVPAAILQKQAPPNNAPRGPSRRATAPQHKYKLRRLPPGLTKAEFEATLGDEWKVGGGKVNWDRFDAGKVSKDLAKPSRPSTAYLHLTDQNHLKALVEKVQQASFNDVKNTSRDPVLIGPPSLVPAPFTRIAGGRRRSDARQGTIDQDPDFQEFLEGLTNPVSKPPAVDAETLKQGEKITTTPLIEYLREKKAAKEKPVAKATGKHGRHESREAQAVEKQSAKAAKDATQSPEKGKRPTKADRAARQAVKVLNREAATAVTDKEATPESSTKAASTPAGQRRRERPPVSVAAKIQRDLGLSPVTSGRRISRASTDKTDTTQNNDQNKETSPSSSSTASAPMSPQIKSSLPSRGPKAPRERSDIKPSLAEKTNVNPSQDGVKIPTGPSPSKAQAQQQPAKGPTAARPSPSQSPKSTVAQVPTAAAKATPTAPATSQSSSASRQAFLKHANASQGITEPLLHDALSPFGAIEHLEIDKRKGFAYVDFMEPEGLKNAIAASPVKVAQGAVQILERKDRPASSARPHPVAPIQHHGPPRGGFRGRGAPRGRGSRGGHVGPAAMAVQPHPPSTPNT